MKVHNRRGEGLLEVNREQVVLKLHVMHFHEAEILENPGSWILSLPRNSLQSNKPCVVTLYIYMKALGVTTHCVIALKQQPFPPLLV